jgi:hypothetical protein
MCIGSPAEKGMGRAAITSRAIQGDENRSVAATFESVFFLRLMTAA